MIRFSELFSKAGVVPDLIEGDADVVTLVMDSRKAVPGCCFVCMPSESTDSHTYLPAAKEAGAVAAIVHSEDGFAKALELGLVTALVRPDSPLPSQRRGAGGEGWPPMREQETPEQRIRRTTGRFSEVMWRLAKVAFDDPSTKLKVIGVTGTNGKTTTAWLIRDMLNLLGIPCAYIGTLGFGLPLAPMNGGERGQGGEGPGADRNPSVPIDLSAQEDLRPLANTTPFSIELNAMLAEAVERGCQVVAMEVSSHALSESRVDGLRFAATVFTNFSQDHLDYHGTMEDYLKAKSRLFSDFYHPPLYDYPFDETHGIDGTWSAINYLDPVGLELIDQCQWEMVVPFGAGLYEDDLDAMSVLLANTTIELSKIELWIRDGEEPGEGWAPLGGEYNVWNLLAAVTAVEALGRHYADRGLNANRALEVAHGVRPVPGRFEPVPNDSGIGIIVDYAHTPDALEKLLATVRPLTKGKVITVFGCGGDRDKSKRPLMARAAQAGSDIVVVTSDNPRTEDPMEIIRDVTEGLDVVDGGLPISGDAAIHNPQSTIHIHPDRPEAVALAIQLAEPGDTVVIAGKGHENYQIIGRTKHHMDDRELARTGLDKKGSGSAC